MTGKPTKRDHDLINYYVYKSGQQLNRYKSVWAAKSLLEDYDDADLRVGIDFFLQTDPFPTWDRFVYKAADVITAVRQDQKDRLARQRMRDETLRLVAADGEPRSTVD